MSSRDSNPSPATNDAAKREVSRWLQRYGDAVYGYAASRVESGHVAEELVQETFLAALVHFDRFQGESSPKTWLMAILRNKIIEHYRKRSRGKAKHSDQQSDVTFDERGIWNIPIGNWPRRPDQVMEDSEFWEALAQCLAKLPAAAMEVFMLRVLDGWETDRICKTLNISASNMAVRLHRARIQLRNCLGRNWFGDD